MFKTILFLPVLLLTISFARSDDDCNLSQELINEIQSYQPAVNRIIDATTNGQFKGATFNELATFVDKFGARLSGTKNLEDSIDYLLDRMAGTYALDNVHGEEVQVPHWLRGNESAQMLQPREAKLAVLALGGSVGTPAEGIEAEVVVVKSMEDLHQHANSLTGKIVVFNYEYVRYGVSVVHRSQGPSEASRHGAVAALVRSVTDFSINLPHTGQTSYADDVTKIPALAITAEDANMFQRHQDRGETIKVKLYVTTEILPEKTSRNAVAEIAGSEKPNKVVLVSGHIDSWDVGVGALDDGGGVFISWYSLAILRSLGLTPKRTVRAVLWTAEENGMAGVNGYDAAHKRELEDFIFVMESDEGTFTPQGLEFIAAKKGTCILTEILKLLAPINTTQAVRATGGVGSDITIWRDVLPTGSLLNDNANYFWYHHTKADTMDALDPDALDKATALWASVAYVLADLKDDFPRELTDSGFYTTPNILYIVLLSLLGFLLHQ